MSDCSMNNSNDTMANDYDQYWEKIDMAVQNLKAA